MCDSKVDSVKNSTNSKMYSTNNDSLKLIFFTKFSRMIQQFFHVTIFKRKRNITNEKKRNEYRNKIARVIMIFLIENFDICEHDK